MKYWLHLIIYLMYAYKSIYLDNMKNAIIKPIYKNNNIQFITNYRPISLLP